ncbi:aldehyde dehydrogenase family protein [Thermoplasmatales archaeon AK]|nr:aldehyde dehydrogenase family protein [Thermoplasmatales archaeon AK]
MKILIDGEWRDSSSGDVIEKISPVDGHSMGTFPAATKEDVDAAIDAAEQSQEAWFNLGSVARSRILYRARDFIESNRQELETILMNENGKVKIEARQEVDGVLDQIQYYAEFARKITGDIVEGDTQDRKIFQYLVPYGVVVALTPWNFPAAMVARKLAPALLTGNSVVLKPSSDTPFSAEWIVRMFQKAGLPKGVLNLITGRGSEIGDYIVAHPKVSAVTMTGSTATGQRIMQKASANMAKLILELGGKAPYIVWKDADLKRALTTLMWAKFWNVGQSCIAAERLYVHKDVYADFMRKFVSAISKLKVGDPETADVGPLINKGALENMKKFVEKAKDDGGKVLTGGAVPSLSEPYSHGFFFKPTVIEGVGQNSELFQEEVFGPVIGVAEISTEDEAISKANNSKYGLASYLFTRDPDFIFRAAERVRFGELYVNMPGPESSQGYHTGFRLTGQAGEGSKYGIREYLKIKNVYIDYSKGDLRIETVRQDLFR